MTPGSPAEVGTRPTDGIRCPDYPPHVGSLLGVLQHQLEWMPDRIVCHRIIAGRNGFVSTPLTVRELVDRATRAAASLRTYGVRAGDRVIVSLSDPHHFLVAFFASLATGASPVPLPTVGEAGAPRSFAARVRAVCRDCAPALAVVDARQRFEATVGTVMAGERVVDPEALDSAPASASPELSVALEDRSPVEPAFIQYTSGSTGTPKGVVVTHGNILANCRAIRDATGYTRADRMVSWLPLHHDMGLVGGLLTSVYCAAETWLMSPVEFLARPVAWLEAIGCFAATLTVAPTFAYALCARKLPDKQLARVNLASLRLAYIGAEPIDRATLEAFVARFRPYGLSPRAMFPVYGLAEATLAVAFPEPGSPVRYDSVDRRRLAADRIAVPVPMDHPDGVTFVSVGRSLPQHFVEVISHETGDRLGHRRVGELIVAGASVTPGYFADRPTETRACLQTGDLGYVADGHLYVVDRIRDLVIINGQNYAPIDIERAAAEVPGVRRGRVVAFSSPGEGTEALHVVAEASPDAWRPPTRLAEDVRARIRRELGLAAVTVTIVVPGTLERTSSGKLKRRACAEAHRSGTLAVLRRRSDLLAYRLRRRAAQMRQTARRLTGHALAWIGGVGVRRTRVSDG